MRVTRIIQEGIEAASLLPHVSEEKICIAIKDVIPYSEGGRVGTAAANVIRAGERQGGEVKAERLDKWRKSPVRSGRGRMINGLARQEITDVEPVDSDSTVLAQEYSNFVSARKVAKLINSDPCLF